jgi:type IX secretion system PorP/SprF family membrane protein
MCVISVTAQQKTQFTQYMFNGLVINPATAGSDQALSLTFIERKQWAGVENAPETQTLSAHTLFKKTKTGIGLTLVNDKIGVHKNMNALAAYAYHLKISETTVVSLGLQAGLYRRKSDYSSLQGTAMFDPRTGNAAFSRTFFDVGSGIYFRHDKIHVGISAPSLLPDDMAINDSSIMRLNNINLLMFSKYVFKMNDYFDFEPSVLIKYHEGVPFSYDINLNAVYRKALTCGLSYRKKESVDLLVKAQVTRQLQFGYAYDHPVGITSRLSSGSHEFMVQYVFRYIESGVRSPR